MIMFAYRELGKYFFRIEHRPMWIGVWRDKSYTYFADGTNETNKETSFTWSNLNEDVRCVILEKKLYPYHCKARETKYLALCERPVCPN